MIKEIKIEFPKTPLFDPKLAESFFKRQRSDFFNKILPIIQTGIITETPVGATGILRGSIKIKKMDNIGSVFTTLKYALAVNDGRKAAPVARAADPSISAWLRRSKKGQAFFGKLKAKHKKMTLKKAIFILKISKKFKKTEGQLFFEKGIDKVQPILARTFNDLLGDIADGINA